MNRGFGINFLDEVSESMKNQWSMLHTSHQLYKMFASVLLVQSPSRYPTKKNKAHQNCGWPKFPTVFRGQKKQIPVFVWSKMSKITAFSAGWQTSRACARHEPRPKPLGIRPHLPGNININHWSLGQKFWTRLRSLHRNTVSR